MRIPQVRIDAVREQICDQLVRPVPVAKPCPCIDPLAHAPARAGICPQVHGHFCRLKPFRRILCDQVAREKPQHMGEMTVTVSLAQCIAVGVMVVCCLDIPLFDLSVLTDLDGSFQIVEFFLPVREHSLILAHEFSRGDRVGKELPDQGLFVCISIGPRTCLRRIGR